MEQQLIVSALQERCSIYRASIKQAACSEMLQGCSCSNECQKTVPKLSSSRRTHEKAKQTTIFNYMNGATQFAKGAIKKLKVDTARSTERQMPQATRVSELRRPQHLTGQLHLGSPAPHRMWLVPKLSHLPADAFDTCCSKVMMN